MFLLAMSTMLYVYNVMLISATEYTALGFSSITSCSQHPIQNRGISQQLDPQVTASQYELQTHTTVQRMFQGLIGVILPLLLSLAKPFDL